MGLRRRGGKACWHLFEIGLGAGDGMIEGVVVKRLVVHADERGFLFEVLRCDDDIFRGFGQVYITTCYPGVIKAWHMHEHQTDYLCAIKGMIKLVLADLRDDSPTKGEINEFIMGDHNRMLVMIPPRVWHGFTALGNEMAYVLNCPDKPYNREHPDEHRLPYNTALIGYDWGVKHG